MLKVAYITRIRNEERLIYYNLLYYYNIGIRDFYIIFNDSNKETRDRVNSFFESYLDCFNFYFERPGVSYKQPEELGEISNVAFNNGCSWIIPVDADEILRIPDGQIIQDCIAPHDKHEYGYIQLKWIDYHPSKFDNPSDNNYFTRWQYRESEARSAGKIIVKWHPEMKWGDGHHLITTKRNLIAQAGKMVYAHFPNREYEQLRDKIIRIGESFVERFGIDSKRQQVQAYVKWQNQGDQYLKDVWNRKVLIKRKTMFNSFKFDPIDPRLFA